METEAGVLSMWTIYDHPKDFPDTFVARRYAITSHGPVATGDHIVAPELEELRSVFRGSGLVALKRSELDDPVIVETWV